MTLYKGNVLIDAINRRGGYYRSTRGRRGRTRAMRFVGRTADGALSGGRQSSGELVCGGIQRVGRSDDSRRFEQPSDRCGRWRQPMQSHRVRRSGRRIDGRSRKHDGLCFRGARRHARKRRSRRLSDGRRICRTCPHGGKRRVRTGRQRKCLRL